MLTEAGQTVAGPLMEQGDGPVTVKTTRLLSVQPARSVTVKSNVAVAGAPLTYTVAGRLVQLVQELGPTMVVPGGPESMLHAIELMALLPG